MNLRPAPTTLTTTSACFGELIEGTDITIECHVVKGLEAAASDYLAILGKPLHSLRLHDPVFDWEAVEAHDDESVIPIFFMEATDPTLREHFFAGRPMRFFVDQFYRPAPGFESNRLYIIGTTDQAWRELGSPATQASPSYKRDRLAKLKHQFGPNYLHPTEVEQALKSEAVERIRLHALGSEGTNIARATRQFVTAHALQDRAEVIVHPNRVEPLQYAQVAAEDVRSGVFPLHTECAVYYELDRMFDTRSSELVFAAHHYMPLDGMQLAARTDQPVEGGVIASHPSPKGLVRRWQREGSEVIAASSNTHAAAMVLAGEADMCVTTTSAAQAMNLATIEHFGSPLMMFTFGTPLNRNQIRDLL